MRGRRGSSRLLAFFTCNEDRCVTFRGRGPQLQDALATRIVVLPSEVKDLATGCVMFRPLLRPATGCTGNEDCCINVRGQGLGYRMRYVPTFAEAGYRMHLQRRSLRYCPSPRDSATGSVMFRPLLRPATG